MSRSASHIYEPPGPESDEVRPAVAPAPAPLVFDCASVRAVDRAAIEEYGIPGAVLMENAARGLAEEAMRMLRRAADITPHVLIFCGAGNNGGDGYALARHLHNRRIEVSIVSLGEPRPGTDAFVNEQICRRMRLRRVAFDQLEEFVREAPPHLIVDAIFGTGLDRAVAGEAAQAIEWINDNPQPVLAADIPSGLNGDTGEPMGNAVRATRTVTFVGLKTGFLGLGVQKILGEVVVKDIGAPRELLERFGRPLDGHQLPPDIHEHEPIESPQLRWPRE